MTQKTEQNEKSYVDFLDNDIKTASKKLAEHKQQANFHKEQSEYWERQLSSLSGIRFRVSADAFRLRGENDKSI